MRRISSGTCIKYLKVLDVDVALSNISSVLLLMYILVTKNLRIWHQQIQTLICWAGTCFFVLWKCYQVFYFLFLKNWNYLEANNYVKIIRTMRSSKVVFSVSFAATAYKQDNPIIKPSQVHRNDKKFHWKMLSNELWKIDILTFIFWHFWAVSQVLKDVRKPVADPGFGQGGAKNIFPRFCRHSEAKSGEQSKQYNISI